MVLSITVVQGTSPRAAPTSVKFLYKLWLFLHVVQTKQCIFRFYCTR